MKGISAAALQDHYAADPSNDTLQRLAALAANPFFAPDGVVTTALLGEKVAHADSEVRWFTRKAEVVEALAAEMGRPADTWDVSRDRKNADDWAWRRDVLYPRFIAYVEAHGAPLAS